MQPSICRAPKCDDGVKVKGLCRIHYDRWRRTGRFDRRIKQMPCSAIRPRLQDIAWIAGVLEGDGCFYARLRKGTHSGGEINTAVIVGQKDRWLPERLRLLLGGAIYVHRPSGGFQWHVGGARARGLAMTVFPFMSPRRQVQIKKMLEIWKYRNVPKVA